MYHTQLLTICIFIFIAATTVAQEQELLTLTAAPDFLNKYQYETVDTATGKHSILHAYGNSNTMGGLLANECSMDSKFFYFTSTNMTGSQNWIYRVQASNGNFVSRTTFNEIPVLLLESDTSDGMLYGVAVLNHTSTLGSINLDTGAITPIVKFAPLDLPQIGVSTYCSFGHRFIFVMNSDNYQLVRVDVRNKNIISNPAIDYLPTSMELNGGSLYATIFDPDTYSTQLVDIDMDSGKITKTIATFNNYPYVVGGSYLDSKLGDSGVYYFAGSDNAQNSHIVAVDLATGKSTASPSLDYIPICLNKRVQQ
jgi:hypothetical protein